MSFILKKIRTINKRVAGCAMKINRSARSLNDRKARSLNDRKGCDSCKIDKPTECFEGYVGGVLWICRDCYKKLITWKEGAP